MSRAFEYINEVINIKTCRTMPRCIKRRKQEIADDLSALMRDAEGDRERFCILLQNDCRFGDTLVMTDDASDEISIFCRRTSPCCDCETTFGTEVRVFAVFRDGKLQSVTVSDDR